MADNIAKPNPDGDHTLQEPKPQRSEYAANRFFMAVSLLLILFAVAGFLWLTGVIEWRGSDGLVEVSVVLKCKDADPKNVEGDVFVNFEEDSISFSAWTKRGIDIKELCPRTEIHSKPIPSGLTSLGTVDAPGDDKDLDVGFSQFTNSGGQLLWYEANIDTVDRLGIKFDAGKMLRFVGLSEQHSTLQVKIDVAPVGTYLAQIANALFMRPPEYFYIASSRPAGSSAGYEDWQVDAHTSKVELSFKNDDMARLDHIIDSSIAAVLGVGVGGFISAWLALRIGRSRKSHD